MKITPFGIIFAVLAIVAIIYIWERLRHDLLGVRSAVMWLFLWFFVGIFSLFPDFLNVAMRVAQMENRMSFVLLSAVLVLYALLFNVSSRLDRMERNIARVTQELALVNGGSSDQKDLFCKDDDS